MQKFLVMPFVEYTMPNIQNFSHATIVDLRALIAHWRFLWICKSNRKKERPYG